MEQIVIDITDWQDTVQHDEMEITSVDDIIELIRSGKKTGDVAIAGIVNQHVGKLTDERFRQPKSNLYFGAQQNIQNIIKSRVKAVKVNDLTATYKEFIGPNGDGGDAYVESTTSRGVERARKNLHEHILAYIQNQVLILLDAGEDWKSELEQLKIGIDEMIIKFTEPEKV